MARAVFDEQIEEEDQVLQVDQDEEDGGGADEEKGDGEDGVADVDDEEGEVDEGSWRSFRQKHLFWRIQSNNVFPDESS